MLKICLKHITNTLNTNMKNGSSRIRAATSDPLKNHVHDQLQHEEKIGYKKSLSEETYRMIYHLPHIRVAAVVNKLKLFQTWICGISVPSTLFLQNVNILPLDTISPVVVVNVAACTLLYTAGIIFHKVVGSIYLSADGNTVKLSYLNFWGKRQDDLCPIMDILPFSELKDNPTDLYLNLLRYSTTKSLKLTLRYGVVKDADSFQRIFGSDCN